VAVNALDGRGGTRLAVKFAVAMHVGQKVTVHAVHPLGQVNVFKMDGFGELLRSVVRNDVIIQIQQIAPAVLLEHRAEDPAMPVIIRELRLLELRIQLGDLFQEIEIAPQPSSGGGFRIIPNRPHQFLIGRIVLFGRIHEFPSLS